MQFCRIIFIWINFTLLFFFFFFAKIIIVIKIIASHGTQRAGGKSRLRLHNNKYGTKPYHFPLSDFKL